ncbi:M23 family metallopeptidase [Antarcticibacterium flavum]|uniref:M23 family metallopeptidase n=1 Tax=Antarcticibacterium flavum TaxID=2058175 RepID=A0A5B7WZ66_9FLAO|nr:MULTISPECIES: M23 family metallopeptidase [Antarcticibacterium]MCM4161762.1 hypothetical protein [Antarcticibacterium sp. W02-3]QCY68409.1 M23 family metallopeptidase [Antarcticibacterium flavum]
MSPIINLIKTEYHTLQPQEILQSSPIVLMGVTTKMEKLLKTKEIFSVFDLSSSKLFNDAVSISKVDENIKNPFHLHGQAASDMVKNNITPLAELPFAGIEVLDLIEQNEIQDFKQTLNVETVRDLAIFPPFTAAVKILNSVYFPESQVGFDPEAPTDLIPKTGEYPTERVQFTTLLLDEIHSKGTSIDLTSDNFSPIDIGKVTNMTGFEKIATGALLTFNQSWFMQGVTLGQLLHSTALAPGESTRIVVIDWSRKTRASQTESITEQDELTNETRHARSINEVTNAVATEAQQGFSESSSSSTSLQVGISEAGDSGLLGAIFGGGSGGYSEAYAENSAAATSFSSSWGQREVAASMAQHINDRTHQHAHSTRSRRASVVKEVSQSEHEQVSSRVITNYNHMHALTIQYYEVVQVYRVEVELNKAEKCLYIPLKLIDFSKEEIIEKFRLTLLRSALSRDIRQLLMNYEVVEFAPGKDLKKYPNLNPALINAISTGILSTAVMSAGTSHISRRISADDPETNDKPKISFKKPIAQQILDGLWSESQLSHISNMFDISIIRPKSSSIFIPVDALIKEAMTNDEKLSIKIYLKNGTIVESLTTEISVSNITKISVKGSHPDKDILGKVTLTLSKNGVIFPLELPTVTVNKGSNETIIVVVNNAGINKNLKEHLNGNKLHYSLAIFRSLDTAQMAALLAGYTYKVSNKNIPVSQLVDPKPIGYVGNYLVFKMTIDTTLDAEWEKWLKERNVKKGIKKQDIVPLSSGGVFAEAVLGRFNCAEKLDITRFWNWQDSPIPIQPAEIAAIQTGSRATQENVTPGQLSNPIINMQAPTTLPDPTGMAGILAAIQNGNMFRDMSGLSATIGLAQAALQATTQAATAAGQQAGTNMSTHLQAQVERAKVIGDLAKAALTAYTGVPLDGDKEAAGKNASKDGAKINYFDKNKTGGTEKGETPSSPNPPANSSSKGKTSSNYTDNPAALSSVWGSAGQSQGELINQLGEILDKGVGGGNSAVAASTYSFTPQTVESKFEHTSNPRYHQKITFKEEVTKDKIIFSASNATEDYIEIYVSFSDLVNMESEPGDISGKPVLLAPGESDKHIAKLKMKDPGVQPSYKVSRNFSIGDSAASSDGTLFALPYKKNKKFEVSQTFSGTSTHNNAQNQHAVDFLMPLDTVICAARAGKVVDLEDSYPNNTNDNSKLNYIRILHTDKTYSQYLHLTKDGATVSLGDTVTEGQAIGKSGNSGKSSGPHLHISVAKGAGDGTLKTINWKFKDKNGDSFIPEKGKEYKNE